MISGTSIYDLATQVPLGYILNNQWDDISLDLTSEQQIEIIKEFSNNLINSSEYRPLVSRDYSESKARSFIADCYESNVKNLRRIYNVQPIVIRQKNFILGQDFIPQNRRFFLFDCDNNWKQSDTWKAENKDWLGMLDHIWRFEIRYYDHARLSDTFEATNKIVFDEYIHRFQWRFSFCNITKEQEKVLLELDVAQAGISLEDLKKAKFLM